MDIFSTTVLNGVVQRLNQPSSFLLDRFFTQTQMATTEEIYFDIDTSKPRIAPFVSPLVAGKVVPNDGYQTKSFKPAYVKDKRRFTVTGPLKRAMGEQIGGSMSPMERRDAQVALTLQKQLESLTLREIVMASEALRLGQVTVTGEQYPTVVVNFARDAALTITLSGAATWDSDGVDVLGNLETWIDLIQSKSGGVADTVVFDPKAWALARKNVAFMTYLQNPRSSIAGYNSPGFNLSPIPNKKLGRLVGVTESGIEFYVFQDTYTDETGALQQQLPDYTVLVGSAGYLEGTRCYGMILDEGAGYQSMRYYSKSWIDNDPPIRWMLLQSAPLIVPYRVNAVAAITVKS